VTRPWVARPRQERPDRLDPGGDGSRPTDEDLGNPEVPVPPGILGGGPKRFEVRFPVFDQALQAPPETPISSLGHVAKEMLVTAPAVEGEGVGERDWSEAAATRGAAQPLMERGVRGRTLAADQPPDFGSIHVALYGVPKPGPRENPPVRGEPPAGEMSPRRDLLFPSSTASGVGKVQKRCSREVRG